MRTNSWGWDITCYGQAVYDGDTGRLLKVGPTCTKTNTEKILRNNTCIHQSLLLRSPSHCHSLTFLDSFDVCRDMWDWCCQICLHSFLLVFTQPPTFRGWSYWSVTTGPILVWPGLKVWPGPIGNKRDLEGKLERKNGKGLPYPKNKITTATEPDRIVIVWTCVNGTVCRGTTTWVTW